MERDYIVQNLERMSLSLKTGVLIQTLKEFVMKRGDKMTLKEYDIDYEIIYKGTTKMPINAENKKEAEEIFMDEPIELYDYAIDCGLEEEDLEIKIINCKEVN